MGELPTGSGKTMSILASVMGFIDWMDVRKEKGLEEKDRLEGEKDDES